MTRFEDLKVGDKIRALVQVDVPIVDGTPYLCIVPMVAGKTATMVTLYTPSYATFEIDGGSGFRFQLSATAWGADQGTTWEAITGWDEAVDAAQPKAPEPRNNDGRSACYWCGGQTVVKPGFLFDKYNYCERCKK